MRRPRSGLSDRWTVAALVGMLVMGCLGTACSSAERPFRHDRVPADLLGPEQVSTAGKSELRAALDASGVDLAGAPADAVAQAGAVFCGVADQRWSPQQNPAQDAATLRSQRCLLEASALSEPAIVVTIWQSTEGDLLAAVWRALSDGRVVVFYDNTRDAYGSRSWEKQWCEAIQLRASPNPGGDQYLSCS